MVSQTVKEQIERDDNGKGGILHDNPLSLAPLSVLMMGLVKGLVLKRPMLRLLMFLSNLPPRVNNYDTNTPIDCAINRQLLQDSVI